MIDDTKEDAESRKSKQTRSQTSFLLSEIKESLEALKLYSHYRSKDPDLTRCIDKTLRSIAAFSFSYDEESANR